MVRVKSTSRKLLKPTVFQSSEEFYGFPMRNESDDYGIFVKISVPSADEECPITQELMQSYDLEFLPNTTFISGYPAYRKLTLPCGHSFSAMALTYHFHKNCMQCPLCRVGSKQPLAPLYIPEHFRAPLQDRVVIERGQALAAEERENLLETLNILRSEISRVQPETVSQFLTTFLSGQAVTLSVYAYAADDALRPCVVLEFPMEIIIPTVQDELQIRLPRASIRDLCRALRSVDGIERFCFVIGTRSPVGAIVELDRTAPFVVSELVTLGPHGGYYIPAATVHPSHFELWRLANSDSIESIQWFASPSRFLDAIFGGRGTFTRQLILVSGDPSLVISLDDMDD